MYLQIAKIQYFSVIEYIMDLIYAVVVTVVDMVDVASVCLGKRVWQTGENGIRSEQPYVGSEVGVDRRHN